MPAVGGIASFQDGYEDEDLAYYPETVPRRIGDCPCCLLFLICLGGLGYLQFQSAKLGSLERYEGLTDYNGKFCGVSSSVVDKPYVFFCQQPGSVISRRDRICVADCGAVQPTCPGGDSAEEYSAFNYAGILCLPHNPELREQIGELFLLDPYVGLFLAGTAFSRGWPAVFLSMIVSVVLAFLYMCLISRCMRPCVLCGVYIIVVATAVFGIVLMDLAKIGGADGITHTGDEHVGYWTGVMAVATAALVLTVSLCFTRNINLSIACIKAGAECIWDSPSIVFEPFMHVAVKLLLLVVLLAGLLKQLTWMEFDDEEYAGEVSIRVRFNYTPMHLACLAYTLVMIAWIMEILNGISYISTSYAAQSWFFAPYDGVVNSKDVSSAGTCMGFAVTLRYHLGTVVYGSAVIALLRVPRAIMGVIFYCTYGGEPNACTRCVGACCSCCFLSYDGLLRYFSPWAFMDVALNGSRFCKAAYFSTTAMDHQAVKFLSMHSSSWLVQFVGHFFVAAAGGFQTYLMCRSGYLMGELGAPSDSIHSRFYIPRPSIMGFLAALVCWGAAHPFLVLPGHVSDNILFCYAVERQRWLTNPIKTLGGEGASLFHGMGCSGRRLQEHHAGSTRAQPPATHALLEEARNDRMYYARRERRDRYHEEDRY